MARFAVPRKYQQTVLLIGIILALVLRGIFIAVGAAADQRVLLDLLPLRRVPGLHRVHLARQGENDDEDFKENAVIRLRRSVLNATDEYDGVKLTVQKNGKRLVTPMAIVIIALGTTDLLFALDSIPAIFGLTQEPYLVFAANVFALMGLRQLYFLLGGLLERLVYLSIGLSVVLAFIGVKLVLHAMHVNELPFINGGHHIDVGPRDPDLVLARLHHRHPRHHHRSPASASPAPSRTDPAVGRRRRVERYDGSTAPRTASNGPGPPVGARARPEDQGRARRHPPAGAPRVGLQEALT